MNLLRASEVTVTPTLVRIRAILLTTALLVTGCVSSKQSPESSPMSHSPRNEFVDVDIDNPVFIALVGISAEIQAEIESNPKSRSLQFIWETATERLQEMKLKNTVSVYLIPTGWTGRGCSYAAIEAAGQQAMISAKDEKTAIIRTLEAQQFCIEYIRYRIEMSLGGNPATEDQLRKILRDEESVFIKHRMTLPNVVETKDGSWDIVFNAKI